MKLIFFSVLFLSSAWAGVVEKTVALVNDQVILLSEIDTYRQQLQKGGMVDDLIITNKDEVLRDRAKLVDLMINERIIDSEVTRQNLGVTVERVEQEIRQIAGSNGISRNQLKQALKEQGIDFAAYQNFLKKRIERHALIERVITSKIRISDEDIASYYLQTKGEAAGREVFQYKIAHILFTPKSGDVDAAEQRAKSVLDKISQGKSFETLASQYSEDPSFTSGGLLGTFKSGEFLPELEKAVEKIPVNQTSGIVKSKVGFHILKLLDKNLIPSPDFEQNKAKISAYLSEQAFRKQFSFWLTQKRQESFIRIN